MYSRRTSGRRTYSTDEDFSTLPPDYSGNAFGQFGIERMPETDTERKIPDLTPSDKDCTGARRIIDGNVPGTEEDGGAGETERIDIPERTERTESNTDGAIPTSVFPADKKPGGLSDAGLEELLLLGVIFLIFSDEEKRDNELLISLLLIYFI